jgi:hypothetical protein
MPEYRRNRVLGATCFFTVNLLDRRFDLHISIASIRGKPSVRSSKGARSPSTCGMFERAIRLDRNFAAPYGSLGDLLT